MRQIKILTFLSIFFMFKIYASTLPVTSQIEFDEALDNAVSGDIIEWANGTYSDIYMEIREDNITVQAETPGLVIFNGTSRARLRGDNITFTGFQYIGGDILDGTTSTINQTIITIDGSNTSISHINFLEYTCFKYMRIRDSSQFTTVSYCNFENRINYADQNILQIDVNESQPGFHKVRFCSFKNFSGDPDNITNGDDGVEPIRTGSSSQASRSCRSIIEYCYFTKCNGDDEVISGKATDCIYRYNTLEANDGEIVLRHGNAGVVYGNFFIDGEAGVRVREGSDHIIYNNYFSGLTDKSIDLQASKGDLRVQNVTIAHNTFINTDNIDLGDNDATNDPLNTVLINNVFENTTSSNHFRTPTGTETWFGNIIDNEGDLGIDPTPSTGITFENAGLTVNSDGFYQLPATSPVINNAVDNFVFPLIEGVDYDNTIALDLLLNERDNLKDVGSQEFSATAQVIPHVNEENTGPSYLMPGAIEEPVNELSALDFNEFSAIGGSNDLEIESNVDWTLSENSDWLSLSKTSGSDDDIIEITAKTNTGGERSAILTLTGGDLTVSIIVTQSKSTIIKEADYIVSSQVEFDEALDNVVSGDIIEWANGTYSDIYMEIREDEITVRAETAGLVIFNGTSRTRLRGDNITFTGFQYIGGDILDGTTSTINQTIVTIDGSFTNFSQINFSKYSCWKYLRIRDASQYTTVSYCNFENRINYADQNIFQIDVNESQPGFHKVQYCSFKNFSGDPDNITNGDDGVEPIRTGSSSQASRSCRTIIENCYFTKCNGDDEVISGKATDCIYRYNTLEANDGEIVLRHGNAGVVYGNFFINGEAGVRVREGSDHIIYNNYFSGLTDKSIDLQASKGDLRVQNVTIAHNTFINTDNIDLGDNDATNDPLNTVLINNVFENTTSSNHFRTPTGTETWFGNIIDNESDLGITPTPSTGITFENAGLTINSDGFYQLPAASPVIDNAVDNFVFPLIGGVDYDNTIALDLLLNERDNLKDVGSQEFSATAQVIPHANEENTGPNYLMPGGIVNELSFLDFENFEAEGGTNILNVVSNLNWTVSEDSDWLVLNKTEGSNDDTIEITANANTGNQRATTLTFFSGDITIFMEIVQAAANQLYVIDIPDFNADGTTNILNIRSNVDWTLSEDSDWFSLSETSGSNNGNVSVIAEANTGDQRTATITLSGGGITILVDVLQTAGASAKNLIINNTSFDIITYPNPFVSNLHITSSSNNIAQTIGSIRLTDIRGKIIISETVNDSEIHLSDLESIPEGVYLLQILNEQEQLIITKKVIKK